MELSVYKSTSWKTLPWDQFRSKVFSLQCRIYDAMRNKDIEKTIKLQKCLLHSSASHYIAIKECTDFNIGHKIPGIDGKLISTFKEKVLFAVRIKKDIAHWKNSPNRKVKIFVDTGVHTFFSIPNIEDRIIYFIWKLALEPAHEAIFVESSYGFRAGRNVWDMQKRIIEKLTRLSRSSGKNVLILDFAEYFKVINHDVLIEKLIFPSKYKMALYQSLKIGILEAALLPFSYQYSSTSISFLLLNIAFHGLDVLIKNNIRDIAFFRYGPHCLYICDEDNDEVPSLIDHFFYTLGITINHSEGFIVRPLHNFEFLGWCFVIKPSAKIITYPSKSNWIIHKSEIKSILKNPINNIFVRLTKIEKKTKRWYLYHNLCNISEISVQIYSLRTWINRYLRFHTKISKEERYRLVREIFISKLPM